MEESYAPRRQKWRSIEAPSISLRVGLWGCSPASLKAADSSGMQSVNLPAFRTGVMAGAVETEDQAVTAMADAIKRFRADNPSNLKDINVVVFRNQELSKKFSQALA